MPMEMNNLDELWNNLTKEEKKEAAAKALVFARLQELNRLLRRRKIEFESGGVLIFEKADSPENVLKGASPPEFIFPENLKNETATDANNVLVDGPK